VTTFAPSCSVKLTLRLEEFADTGDLNELLPSPDFDTVLPDPFHELPPRSSEPAGDDSQASQLRENQQRITALRRQRDELPADQFDTQLSQLQAERQIIMDSSRQAEDDEGTAPPSVAGSPPDDLTVVGQILPRSATIERNGLATCDTASIAINYTDAPIDPRIIRAAHVEILLGVVSAQNHEDGIERGETRADGSLVSVVGRQDSGLLLGATRFVGFVDTWGGSYAEGGDTLTMECRDMSSSIRDTRLVPGESIDLTQPITEGVSRFLDRIGPMTRGISVIYEGEGDPPTPGDLMPPSRRPRRGRVARRGRSGGERMSAWDHITDVVRGIGLLPVMVGWVLKLIEPRTLYGTESARRMVYGRNISELTFKRNLQGVKVPTIEVRSYDPDQGRTLWARYPTPTGQPSSGVLGVGQQPRPRRANRVPPSGATPDDEIRVMSVEGVTDQDTLVRVARSSFEQLGKQELEGSFSTSDAWSYEMEPEEADLLKIDAGDPVELLIAQHEAQDDDQATGTTLGRITAQERLRRRDYLVGLGWDRLVAERLARLQDATGFQTVFRTQLASLAFDVDSGIKVDVDFINYITVREEPTT